MVNSRQRHLNAASLRSALFVFSDGHVKGSFPGKATGAGNPSSAQKGHVTELTKNITQRSVGPTVSVESAQTKSSSMLLHALKLNSQPNAKETTSTTTLTSLLKTSLKISANDGDSTTVEKKENVLALLKKQLNIPTVKYSDEGDDVIIGEGIDLNVTQSRVTDASKSSPRAATLSNGTGQRILDDAASTASTLDSSASTDSHAGVVSYAPMSANTISLLNLSLRKSTTTSTVPPPNVEEKRISPPSTPPPLSSAKKIVLNKPAVMRLVKHELQPNKRAETTSGNELKNSSIELQQAPSPSHHNQGASLPQRKPRHISEILQKAKDEAKKDSDHGSAITQPPTVDENSGPGNQKVEIASILKNAKRVRHPPKRKNVDDKTSAYLEPTNEGQVGGHLAEASPAAKASPVKNVTPMSTSRAELHVDVKGFAQTINFSADKSEELSLALQSRLQAIATTIDKEPSPRAAKNNNGTDKRNRGKNGGKEKSASQNLVPSKVILQRPKTSVA